MYSTVDMKMYFTRAAKNGQTKKKGYVYYSGNWVQLNTVGSLILFPPPPKNKKQNKKKTKNKKKKKKKTMDLAFSETVELLCELFGPNTSLFHNRWKCLNIFKDDQEDYLTFAATMKKKKNTATISS